MKTNIRPIEEEENDDAPIGRVLSRREVLGIMAGLGGALLLAACDPTGVSSALPTSTTAAALPTTAATSTAVAAPTSAAAVVAATATTAATAVAVEAAPAATVLPACVVRPEETEGPYFVDEMLNRSDIRSDPSTGTAKEGLPLTITFLVSQISSGCAPLAGAQIDIWHCDALGVYSDTKDPGWNTVGQKFLRGYQLTDDNGAAQFTTIYPGWYQGRTVHIHFKIRTSSDKTYDFTSQLFFDDTVTDQVHAQAPYASKGQRTLKNDGDGIYQNGGSQLLLPLTKTADGYASTFDIGLQI